MTNSARVLDRLRDYESRNVTFLAADGSWPIVWDRARGCRVWDLEGRAYLDLTAAFGVAAAGHANPAVVRAARHQAGRLLHAMGDVHPHSLKAELVRELSRLTFERWTRRGHEHGHGRGVETHGRVLLGNSGFEAVEAALKTARLATGRAGIIAFEGGYHGLGYGALNATHRDHFREPFRDQLREFGEFVRFPDAMGPTDCTGSIDSTEARAGAALETTERQVRKALRRRRRVGAILVEPIQARGGIRIPPAGFLPLLRRLADEHGALLILDEIYTGFGRTGRWFACEHEGVVPDLICLGKALTGGFPLSACVGRAELMDKAWPPSSGEAIHTSTFLGHPVGCAMALAQIREIRRLRLPARAAAIGRWLGPELERIAGSVTGAYRAQARVCGLMAGLELRRAGAKDEPAGVEALAVVQRLLARGFILLPEGAAGEVIGLTPPLTIPAAALRKALKAVQTELARLLPGAALRGREHDAPTTATKANRPWR